MKKYIFSKTIWISILEILSGVCLMIAGSLESGVPLTIVGVIQFVLRAITKEPVSLRG